MEDFEGSPYPKDALMLEQNVLGDNLLGNHLGDHPLLCKISIVTVRLLIIQPMSRSNPYIIIFLPETSDYIKSVPKTYSVRTFHFAQ